ncbi:MAG: hypothetical protein QT10_C0001G0118 [archaeon GW2011_AR19]|nr:MAG: hypothetical protein QT10_C0001G0118 [archaeon GW2011_AR19]
MHGLKDYKGVIEKIGKYFESMDSKYYSELEGKPDDMEELVKYLNNLKI